MLMLDLDILVPNIRLSDIAILPAIAVAILFPSRGVACLRPLRRRRGGLKAAPPLPFLPALPHHEGPWTKRCVSPCNLHISDYIILRLSAVFLSSTTTD
eukprot:4389317-Pleurochrysis_carterae.AAC.1